MSYIPYTGSKDYFEEPLTGGDLIIMWTTIAGVTSVTAIAETDLPVYGLVPPSSRMGVTYGKPLDLIKIYIPTTGIFSTNTLTTGTASPLTTFVTDTLLGTIVKARSLSVAIGIAVPPLSENVAGKVLRIDYLPTSDGGKAMAVITLLMYV